MLRTGAAYYPEAWPEETWKTQARRMREIGFTTLRVGEFAWALLEPEEGRFEFDWLDRAIATLAAEGLETILGTPTAAPPQWLTRKYPDTLFVTPAGLRHPHGARRHVCMTSPTYRRLTERIVRALGQRYAANPNVVAFQTDNEFCCEIGICYCDQCQAAFRRYLRDRYGTIERLQEEWDARFWSILPRTFDDVPPENWSVVIDRQLPVLRLEYQRFGSRQICDYHRFQVRLLHETAPGKPVFHNMMGLDIGFDHFQLARDSDLVGYDIYPNATGPDPKTGNPIYNPVRISLAHNVTRSLKRDVPYHVVESPLAAVNWCRINSLPRPGQGRLWAHMAFSHGADTYLTFRWQAVRNGSEKHHCAVLMHDLRMDGPNVETARSIARDAKALGGHLAGTLVKSRVAFAHCYENIWQAQALGKSIRTKDYWGMWMPYAEAMFSLGVPYDIVDLNMPDALDGYDLIILPCQQNLSDAMAETIRRYVAAGGTLLATFMTGWANEFGRMRDVPQPAPLSDLFGIIVQTHDPLEESRTNAVSFVGDAAGAGEGLPVSLWCDIILPQKAQVLAVYEQDFYAAAPALTACDCGKGRAFYVGALPGEAMAAGLIRYLCNRTGVPLVNLPSRVQYMARHAADGRRVDYYLNHNADEVTFAPVAPGRNLLDGSAVTGKLTLKGYDVAAIRAQG